MSISPFKFAGYFLLLYLNPFICLGAQERDVKNLVLLENLITRVRQNFPNFQALEQDRQIALEEMKRAAGGFDTFLKSKFSYKPDFSNLFDQRYKPSLELESLFPLKFQGIDLKTRYRVGVPDWNWGDFGLSVPAAPGKIELGLSIPILRDAEIDRRRTQLLQADLRLKQAEYQIFLQSNSILEQALGAWMDAVIALQKTKIQEDLLNLAIFRDRALIVRSRAGDISAWEQNDNQRTIQKRQSTKLKFAAELETSLQRLSLYWRNADQEMNVLEKTQIPEGFNVLIQWNEQIDENLRFAYENRRDYWAAQLQIKSLEFDLNWISNQKKPKLNFDFWAFGNLKMLETSDNSNFNRGILAGLVFEFPLQNRVLDAQEKTLSAQIIKAQNHWRVLKDKIRQDLQESLINLKNSKLRLELVKSELELSKQVENGERVRFQQGDSNLLMVYLREENTADAALRLLDYQAEQLKYYLTYLKNRGESLAELKSL